MSNLLTCKNLSKSFGMKKAINNISLDIGKGKFIGLLGPNGSGKSTFIKLCNNLLTPTSGELLIGGYNPGVETKKIISYLPEKTYLNDWMKVSQIIDFFKDFYDDFNTEKAYDMIKRLHIDQQLDDSLVNEIYKLLEKKTAGLEIDIKPKSPIIIDFLKSKIDHYEQYLKTVRKEKESGYASLNVLFRETLKEVWGY